MPSAEPEARRDANLEMQFEELGQQKLAATQGMWIFLATEALFFGVLMASYTVLRLTYPLEFHAASHEMSLAFGTVNTVVLLTSSLSMAQSVRAAQSGRSGRLLLFLLITALLGTAFLTIKGFEYAYDIRHHSVPGPGMRIAGQPGRAPMHLFMYLYWIMTAFHALHLTIGLGLIGYLALRTLLGSYSKRYHNPVEVVGLYWHFVDIVWLFLYPMLYLAGAGAR